MKLINEVLKRAGWGALLLGAGVLSVLTYRFWGEASWMPYEWGVIRFNLLMTAVNLAIAGLILGPRARSGQLWPGMVPFEWRVVLQMVGGIGAVVLFLIFDPSGVFGTGGCLLLCGYLICKGDGIRALAVLLWAIEVFSGAFTIGQVGRGSPVLYVDFLVFHGGMVMLGGAAWIAASVEEWRSGRQGAAVGYWILFLWGVGLVTWALGEHYLHQLFRLLW